MFDDTPSRLLVCLNEIRLFSTLSHEHPSQLGAVTAARGYLNLPRSILKRCHRDSLCFSSSIGFVYGEFGVLYAASKTHFIEKTLFINSFFFWYNNFNGTLMLLCRNIDFIQRFYVEVADIIWIPFSLMFKFNTQRILFIYYREHILQYIKIFIQKRYKNTANIIYVAKIQNQRRNINILVLWKYCMHLYRITQSVIEYATE